MTEHAHPHARSEGEAIAERIRAAAGTVAAPDELRRRIEAQRRSASPSSRRRARRAPRVAAAALAIALVLAVAIVVSGRDAGPRPPSLADAAAVALRPPTAAPPPAGQHGSTLRAPTVDGVTFPNFAYGALDLRAVGVRRDRSRGREVVVVSYGDDDGARIGYAIVAAPAIDVPGNARPITYRGMRFALLRAEGAAVVTWRRAGRTCILASRTVSHQRLLRVAAWSAGANRSS